LGCLRASTRGAVADPTLHRLLVPATFITSQVIDAAISGS
jgi:hypothetical protein